MTLQDVEIKNINIYGEVFEGNLIMVETGHLNNKFKMQNINIMNVHSNGNVIRFKGINSIISFSNVNINNSTSYGSFLYSTAENVNKIYIYIYIYVYIYIYIRII